MSEMKLIEDMYASVPAPQDARLAALRARVLDAALQTPQPGRYLQGRGRIHPLTWPRPTLTGMVAVGMAVVLAVAGVLVFGGSTLAPPASAAVLLNRAAVAALAQPSPAGHQLIYSESDIYYANYTRGGQPHGHILVRQQEWQSPTSPNAAYRASPCVVDGDVQNARPSPCSFDGLYAPGARTYSTYAGLRTLPASPGKLLAYLATISPIPPGLSRYDREWRGASLIANLNPVLPPRFSAALFRAVATIPGVTLVRSTADAAGAHGIGLSRLAGPGERAELIFDPGSYRLIGEQTTALGHGHSPAYVTSASALIRSGFVSSGPVPSGAGSGPVSAPHASGPFVYTDTKVVALYPPLSHPRQLTRYTGSVLMWQSVNGSRTGAFNLIPCTSGQRTCWQQIPPDSAMPAFSTYASLTRLPRTPGALSSFLLGLRAGTVFAATSLVRTSIVKTVPAASSGTQVYIPLTCQFNPGPYAVGQVSSGSPGSPGHGHP